MRVVHEKVYQRLESKAEAYKKDVDKCQHEFIFEPGDFVWAYWPLECHPIRGYNKLSDRKLGPVEVL